MLPTNHFIRKLKQCIIIIVNMWWGRVQRNCLHNLIQNHFSFIHLCYLMIPFRAGRLCTGLCGHLLINSPASSKEEIGNILAIITTPTTPAQPPSIDHDSDKSKLSVCFFFLLADDSQLCMWLWNASKDANLCLTSEVEIIKSFLQPPREHR